MGLKAHVMVRSLVYLCLSVQVILDPNKLQLLENIGSGAFGQVYKAIYKGTVVAAKIVVLAGNNKLVDNELNAYK